jgi:hypothetical protein
VGSLPDTLALRPLNQLKEYTLWNYTSRLANFVAPRGFGIFLCAKMEKRIRFIFNAFSAERW